MFAFNLLIDETDAVEFCEKNFWECQTRLLNWKEFNGGNYGFQLFWCHPESIRKWNRIRLNEQNYSVKFDQQDKVSMILYLLEIQLDEPQKSNGIMWTFSSIVVTNDIDRWHHWSSSRDNNCTLLAHTQVFGGSWNDKKVLKLYTES